MCVVDWIPFYYGDTIMYGCYFYNMDLTHWFDTEAEAREYGEKAGFQYIVISRHELGYN